MYDIVRPIIVLRRRTIGGRVKMAGPHKAPTAEDRLQVLSEIVGALDIERLRDVVKAVQRLGVLRDKADALDAEIREKLTVRERLLGEIDAQKSIRDSLASLGETTHRAAMESVEATRGLRATLHAEVTDLQAELRRLLGDVEQASRQRAVLAGEIDQLEAARRRVSADLEAANRDVSDLNARSDALKSQAQDAQARLDAIRRLATLEDARAVARGAEADRAEARARELESQVQVLTAQRDELSASFRPLLPFQPPGDVPRGWIEKEDPVGSTLPVLDRRALDIFCRAGTGKGMYKKTVLAEALRNYLPHDAYRMAITELQQEAAVAAQPVTPL